MEINSIRSLVAFVVFQEIIFEQTERFAGVARPLKKRGGKKKQFQRSLINNYVRVYKRVYLAHMSAMLQTVLFRSTRSTMGTTQLPLNLPSSEGHGGIAQSCYS